MSTSAAEASTVGIINRLRAVGWGSTDSRVRATWRVLLAMPVLWTLTGEVLAGSVQSTIAAIPSGEMTGGGVAQSLLHFGFFLAALIVWARYLGHQSLSNYGVLIRRRWVKESLIGFAAVLAGAGVWTGVTSVLGGTSVVIAPSIPQGSVLHGLAFPFVSLILHAAVQQIVFFRIITKTAAEGLHSRGASPSHATVAAVPVAVLLFILMHNSMTPLRILDLAVAGSIFGLLYVHTGELNLGIGAHFGALYNGIVFSIFFQESGSLSGLLVVLDHYGFPTMIIGYTLVVAWLLWWEDKLPNQKDIALRSGG